jgi:hypothetical protein
MSPDESSIQGLIGKRIKNWEVAEWKPLSRRQLNPAWANETHTCSILYYIPNLNKSHTLFILIIYFFKRNFGMEKNNNKIY